MLEDSSFGGEEFGEGRGVVDGFGEEGEGGCWGGSRVGGWVGVVEGEEVVRPEEGGGGLEMI